MWLYVNNDASSTTTKYELNSIIKTQDCREAAKSETNFLIYKGYAFKLRQSRSISHINFVSVQWSIDLYSIPAS